MADYKDYIVRYDIIADVTKAAEGLQSIANIAKEFEGPMNTLKTAITQVSQSVYQLKQNSQMTFAPKIDVGAFNNQLRAMVTQVRSAAAEMHTAIFQALSGNTAGTKVAQKGIGSALGGTRSVAAIKKDIEAYNKELDKLLGTPKKNKNGSVVRGRDGLIQMNKNGLAKATAQQQAIYQERLTNLEAQKRMYQQRIQQCKAEYAVAEKLEKETAAQQAKVAKAQSKIAATPTSKSTAASQPAKLTNVTPAVIREWKKAFGDAKSKALTVNIRGNATGAGGALTVIEQIQASLKALQSQGTFNINPILNTEGFAAAEAQLTRLAGLSAAVVAPFTPKDNKTKTGKSSSLVSALTKDEKTKLTNAQKQIKIWNDKIAPIQSRLDANRAIPEDQRTPAIKGQITRDTKTLAAYQANRAEQGNIVRTLQRKSTAAAQAVTKTVKPLALDIVGNLSKINVTAKPPVISVVGEITKIQGKVAEAIPVNVKIMADQVAASVRSIPAPTLDVRVNLLTDKAQQQLQTLAAQQAKAAPKPVKSTGAATSTTPHPKTSVVGTTVAPTAKKTPVSTPVKGKKSGTTTPITATIDTKDIISQIKSIPRQTIPVAVKLMWEKDVIGRQEQIKKMAGSIPPIKLNLDITPAIAKLEEFITAVRAASPQNIKLTASGVAGGAAGQAGTTPKTAGVGVAQKSGKQAGHTGHQPLTPRQYRDQLGAHLAKGGILPSNYATQIADQQRRRAWQLDQMKRDAMAAFAQKTPYELAEEERLRKLAPTTAGTGKNKVAWGSSAPAAHTAPNGYKWVRANDLTSYLNPEQQQYLAKLRGDESNARGNVARTQSQIARSTGKSNARLEAARTQYAAIQKQMEPYLKQMAQLEEMKKPLLSLKKPNKTQRSALARIESSQAALQTQIDQYRQAQAPFANAIQHETALMARYGTMSSNALSAATQQHSSAQAAVSRYTDGWKLAQTNPKGKPSESNIQKAARLQAQAQNAMLPFAQSKEQLNMLTKHRRYFRQAVATTGIMPTPGMEAPQMLKYLQGVSTQMQKASVAVPWTLQSQINKLEGDVAKANGVGQPTQSRGTGMVPMRTGQPKPFFDRSRRWAYPFTGQTSFGVRTPMAVDMAKGMGVMFAIGGAMSAIGSSFSQAMEYQTPCALLRPFFRTEQTHIVKIRSRIWKPLCVMSVLRQNSLLPKSPVLLASLLWPDMI